MLKSSLSPADKEYSRLADEAQTVIGAGLSTTAWSLTTACFYISSNPEILKKLQEELFTAIPHVSAADAFSYRRMEQLPYLAGCVKEGIRLSHAVSGRNPRIFDFPLQFEGHDIPAGIPVSMTWSDIHFDENIYPQPWEFKPERWVGNPRTPNGESLEKYWVAFGKGPRMCLGIK